MGRDEMVSDSARVLSTDERALCGDSAWDDPLPSLDSIEAEQCWLFFHLDCARRARMRMDRMQTWNLQYVNEYRAHELALAGAERHYALLQSAGAPIPDLLATMYITEGLNP
ncbi:MAG TPA: hypothetical protein VLH12_08435 [Usitatibacter sp.]|nr:hypothetical protein [Usitatibacter sp.]